MLPHLEIKILPFFMFPQLSIGIEIKLEALEIGLGSGYSRKKKIRDHIQKGFSDLYSTGVDLSILRSNVSNFSCRILSEEDQDCLGREVSKEDIKEGLWALKDFKAPGPNGLHASFFQHF